MRLVRSLSICLALICSVPIAANAFVSDHFSGTQLDSQLWTTEDPVGNAAFFVSGGALTMSLPAGTAHDVWTTGNKSARAMQPAANEDFEIEVKFLSVPTLRYQLQGLLIEQDTGNYLRYDYYSDGSNLRIFAASFIGGSPTVLRDVAIAATSGPVWLRVRRSGNDWVLTYSLDNVTWIMAASFSRVMTVRRGGPFVGNAGSAPAFTAGVDYFFNTASPVDPDDPPPGPDVTPPQIYNMQVAAISDTAIDVSWSTNEPADSVVQYGLTTNYELGSRRDAVLKTSHKLPITNLAPDNTYQLRISSTDAAANVRYSENQSVVTSALPVIDVWYGDNQTFGALGEPQRWVNILGNVSDPDGIASLTYSLNGGPAIGLRLGPDGKRLQSPGDFVVEFDYQQLNVGQNTVTLAATDRIGLRSTKTVTVSYGGRVWPPIDQTVRWTGAERIQDRAQVVDGLWRLEQNTVRNALLGYDRLIALGDILWQNYEVTVPVTVNGFDPLCSLQRCAGGGPLVGVLVRWPGHTHWGWVMSPSDGWFPMGALGAFYWPSGGNPRLEMYRGSDGQISARDFGASLTVGVPHMFKMRAETVSGVHRYSVRLWRQDAPEPSTWNIVLDEPLSATAAGGLLLVSHHVDASFGEVVISSLGSSPPPSDTTPPVISNVGVAVTANSATITWQTSEPASSRVSYGLTSAYGSTTASATLVTTHAVTLTGLTSAQTYQFRVGSTDASGNAATSTNQSFTTLTATGTPSSVSSDEFSGNSIGAIWAFRDPRGDSSVSVTGTQLAIAVPAGISHDLWSGTNHAPRLVQSVTDGDFEIEVKFDSSVTRKYQLQGIVVERDAGNLLRFDFYSTGSQTRVFAATFTNGSPTVKADLPVTVAVPMYLRVRRTGNQWTQWYSSDGINWTVASSFSFAMPVATVGVFAGNAGSGSNVPSHTALIDYFRVVGAAPPPPDMTPPTISNVQAVVGANSAVISWQTNEASIGSVAYGLTSAYGSAATGGGLATSHSLTLAGLEADRTYHYRVTSTDAAGNAARTADLQFATSTVAVQIPRSDEYLGDLDPALWTFRDPRGDCRVSTTGGQLMITVPAGVSHDVWRNSNHAPRLMQAATNSDFELEVKFDSSVSVKYQLQGILIEQDDQNFLRFDFYSDGAGTRVFAASFVNGSPTVRRNVAVSVGLPMYMRIRRVGNQWTQFYSSDGATWINAVSFSHVLTTSAVGVFAGNAGSDKSVPSHSALMDYFRVKP